MNLKEHISSDLYRAIQGKYENNLYSDSILDAIKQLTNLIREKSKLDGDGANLIGQAFGGSSPKIKLNTMNTQSEIDEQKGFEQILRGVYIGIRNPRTHEQYNDSPEDTNSIIIFIDYLIKRVQKTISYFKFSEYKKRIFDPLFVERDDYAEMLVKEIPHDEIVSCSISILKERDCGGPEKLEYFFKAIFNIMNITQQESLMRLFSNELKPVHSKVEIVNLIRLFKPEFWPMLDDDVKIRIENSMIESVKIGYYDIYLGIKKGQLGTWAASMGEFFKMRNELGQAIIAQLEKNWYSQNYIGEYFIYDLSSIINKGHLIKQCSKNLASATLGNNAKVLKDNLKDSFTFFPSRWRELILKYGLKYKDCDHEYFDELNKSNEDCKLHEEINDSDLP